MGQPTLEQRLRELLSGTQFASTTTAPKRCSIQLPTMLKFIVLLAPLYGAIMGGFSWFAGFRNFATQWPQIAYSAVKMPLLLLATVAIALPAFFVFNSLAGLRDDFDKAALSIIASLATFSVAIVALAPFTLMFYFSVTTEKTTYRIAVLFNALIFAIATSASSISLARNYRNLAARARNHRHMFWVWVFLFAFVGIQLGWTLRPFIGNPFQPTTFFREESFTSAYLQLIRIVRSLL